MERAQLYSSEGGMLGRSRIVGLADMALRATYNEAQGDGNDVAKNDGWNRKTYAIKTWAKLGGGTG